MDPFTIIALINAGTQLAKSLPGLIEGAQTALHPADAAALDAALAEYRTANDDAFARVDAKLAAAAGQG